LVAGAAFIRALLHGEIKPPHSKGKSAVVGEITRALLSVEQVTDCLIDRALYGFYQEEFEDAIGKFAHVSKMVEFFVRCPHDKKPSVNKALFMISEGAFGNLVVDDDGTAGDAGDDNEIAEGLAPPSQATLKKSWSAFATQGPFLFAARHLTWEPVEYLAPDDAESVSETIRLLEDVQQVRQFCGFSRYIQELLISRLDKSSTHRFKFVKFPEDIQSCPMELRPLEDDKLKTLMRYRAPKFLPEEPKSGRR
jgi:hypothetical protein